jgi:hypothetical protein
LRPVGEKGSHGGRDDRAYAGHRQQQRVAAPQLLPPAARLFARTLESRLGGNEILEEFARLPGEGVEVEMAGPELCPVASSCADPFGPCLDVRDASGVLGDDLGDRRRPGAGEAVEMRPPVEYGERRRPGACEGVPDVGKRPPRLGDDPPQAAVGLEKRLSPALAARRRASSLGEGIRAGWRAKSSPARDSTAASMGSDLFFPANAERSRAECRLPMSARSAPAFRSATDSGSHVIDVGSATAITPGHCDIRLVRISMPASVGATTKSSSVSPAPLIPGRRTTTWWLATTAASMPIATGLVASSGTRVLLSLLRTSVPRSELTDGAHGHVREDPRARSRPWTRAPEPLTSGEGNRAGHPCL